MRRMPGREVLVHNVGHHDLYLVLEVAGRPVAAKPRSFRLRAIAEAALAAASGPAAADPAQGWPGLHFRQPASLPFDSPADIRRGFEAPESLRDLLHPAIHWLGVLFPIAETAIARWAEAPLRTLGDRRILLVSSDVGAGPHTGEDTRPVAKLMARWVPRRWEGVACEVLDPIRRSPYELRAAEDFVRDALRPRLAALRREVVGVHHDHWRDHLRLALSVSTGTTPVQLALAAGTRDYRPAFIHVARARQRPTIGEPLMQEAIEHDFTSLDQRAAIPVVRADPVVREAVHQMGRWRAEFRATGAALKREDNFWIRKGWQPVLAVLAVRGEEGDLSWFRGRNLEVSLPTGSLCAERNAIGSALTQMPALDRERIEAIAVLGLPLEHEGNAPPEDPFIPGPNPLSPCGACREWLLKIAEVNPDFRVITFADEDLSHVHVDEVA